jgi:peptidoglycan hydrolase-like protein with peptidoglycan-binding domain
MVSSGMGLRRIGEALLGRSLTVLAVLLTLAGACGGAFVAEASSTSSGSAATCAKWDVSGIWNAHQSNGVVGTFRFTFKQSGTGRVTGNARYSGASGPLSGSLNGSKLDFIVSWSDGQRGHYFGTVSAGSIAGNGFAVANPTITASWSATGTAVCSAETKPPTSTYPALTTGTAEPKVVVRAGVSLSLRDSGLPVEQLQKALASLGLYKGKLDGVFGKDLQAAVTAFEKSKGLRADGVVGPTTAAQINAAVAAPDKLVVSAGASLSLSDSGLPVEQLQKALAALGLYKGKLDGVFGKDLQAAVTAFEKSKGLRADGVVGPTTAAQINAAVTH